MPTDLPVDPRASHKYKHCLDNNRPLPSRYQEAILQEDERTNSRLCLQKLGYEHEDGAVHRLSMLELDGLGPEYSFEDGLRYMVQRAPSVLSAAVDPEPADRSHLLPGFTKLDIQLLNKRIRHRASANTLDSYMSKFPAVPSANEAEQDEVTRRAIAETDFEATVFCPTVSAFRGTAAQALRENETGTGEIFVGQAYHSSRDPIVR